MEVVAGHSSSLLVNLNVQRERAEFCDCVVRLRENPGQLFPAHRCVLAASSPVLASILSSTGALVELQAPSLSGSVLALLLDYIYTGTLHYTQIQHHYYGLLTTAGYLQMDELQEALLAWQRPELSDTDKTNQSDSDDVGGIAQPLTWNADVYPRHEETAMKLKKEDRIYSHDEVQMHPEIIDPSVVVVNGAKYCGSTWDVSSCGGTSEDSNDSVIAGKCRASTNLTPQDTSKDFDVNTLACQMGTEMLRTVEDERNSSSSPHPCCELVPVIRHSSRAAEPSQSHCGSESSVDSSSSALPQSVSPDIHNIAQGVDTTHSIHCGDQTDRSSKFQTGKWRLDFRCSLDQPTLDLRAADPLPDEKSNAGSDSCGDAQAEHTYSNQDSASGDHRCDLFEPHKDWLARTPSQQTDRGRCEDAVTGRLFDYEQSFRYSEQHLSFKVPVDGSMADLSCRVEGEPYHGQIHYHCVPSEDTHAHPNFSHNGYSNQTSDGEEEVFTGQRSLRPTDHVLLLDISSKSAELQVSYKHRPEDKEAESIALCQNGRFGARFGGREDEARRANQTNEGGGSVMDVQGVAGADTLPKAEVMEEDSSLEDRESHSGTLRSRSPPPVPASMSSSSPVPAPSTLSSSMPRNISGRLSTPLHQPFQCSLCERSFSQRGSLNRHVRGHLGVRPFPCPCCPMTFSRQYRVTEHMRVHQRCAQVNDFHKPPAS